MFGALVQRTGKMSPVAGLFSEVQDEVLTDCVLEAMVKKDAVSYTHLTLPTILLV